VISICNDFSRSERFLAGDSPVAINLPASSRWAENRRME